jgi:hypothetical protein
VPVGSPARGSGQRTRGSRDRPVPRGQCRVHGFAARRAALRQGGSERSPHRQRSSSVRWDASGRFKHQSGPHRCPLRCPSTAEFASIRSRRRASAAHRRTTQRGDQICLRRGRSDSGMEECAIPTAIAQGEPSRPRSSRQGLAALDLRQTLAGRTPARSPVGGSTADGMAGRGGRCEQDQGVSRASGRPQGVKRRPMLTADDHRCQNIRRATAMNRRPARWSTDESTCTPDFVVLAPG